jgi:hypothetical protein
MRLSVVDPVAPSIERTKKTLFDPFDFGKWLRLGFCAFLMSLGEGGGGGSSGYHGGGGDGGGGGPGFEPVFAWIRDNLPLVILIVAGVVLIGILFGLLLTWLSSRGHFMFLDGVVRNRGAVVEPWREYAREANSFFLFRICLGLGIFAVVMMVLALCGLVVWPSIQAGEPGPEVLVAILLAIVLLLPFGLLMGFVGMLLDDFIKPIMYLRRVGVREAWSIFNGSMFSGRVGTFVLYFLFKILLGMAIGVIAFTAVCLTCCIAAIPYVSSVILLPLFVFMQAYPLYFIQQFGPEWQFFQDKPAV